MRANRWYCLRRSGDVSPRVDAVKPKIPDHVDVGPYCYTITVDELARHRAQESAQTILLGHTNHDDLTVIINEKMSASLARETLLHEMLHTVNEVTGLRAKWGNAKEERIVRRTSPILLELLRRNPGLVAYLMAAESPDA